MYRCRRAKCTSVDMSRTYLNWARDNFRLNHLTLDEHQFCKEDCVSGSKMRAPATMILWIRPLSNSKRMEGVLDIQRDHVELIQQAMRLLKKWRAYFLNNLRNFTLDEDALRDFAIEDRTAKSIPVNFARRQNIHHCYYIRHA